MNATTVGTVMAHFHVDVIPQPALCASSRETAFFGRLLSDHLLDKEQEKNAQFLISSLLVRQTPGHLLPFNDRKSQWHK